MGSCARRGERTRTHRRVDGGHGDHEPHDVNRTDACRARALRAVAASCVAIAWRSALVGRAGAALALVALIGVPVRDGARRLRRRRLGLAVRDRRLGQPRARVRAGRPRLRDRQPRATSPTSAAKGRSRSAASPPPPSRSTAVRSACRRPGVHRAAARRGRSPARCGAAIAGRAQGARPAPTRSSARCCCRSSPSGCCTGRVQIDAAAAPADDDGATLPESLEIPDATQAAAARPATSACRCTSACRSRSLLAIVAAVAARRTRVRPAPARRRPEPGRRAARRHCRSRLAIVRACHWPARSAAWPAPSCCRATSTS